MASLMYAYHQVWMHHGPARFLYSDGEGALSNPTATELLRAKGTELRIRARGQHATSIESRSGILRHTMHVMEDVLKTHDIPRVLTRLRHEALFVCNAFA